jgi:hypothetical protein
MMWARTSGGGIAGREVPVGKGQGMTLVSLTQNLIHLI